MKNPTNYTRKINVLFINDNRTDLMIIEALLGKHFNIINMTDSNIAINQIPVDSIDIIISNERQHSNVKSRIKILKKILLDPKYQHVKFFALKTEKNHSHEYIKQGFDDVFTMPLVKEEVFEAYKL